MYAVNVCVQNCIVCSVANTVVDAFLGFDFLVYPTSTYQLSLNAEGSNFITFTMTLQVAACVNQDFGNPNINSGVKTVFDQIVGQETDGSSWLDKIADYI